MVITAIMCRSVASFSRDMYIMASTTFLHIWSASSTASFVRSEERTTFTMVSRSEKMLV